MKSVDITGHNVEEKIFGEHSMTEPEARLIAQTLVRAAECGVLHDVLGFAAELFQDDVDAPRRLVRVFKRASEDVDEITQ